MVVSKKPFTRVGRIVAAVTAVVWLAGGVLALLPAVRRGLVVLGILGVLAIGLGVVYAIAAWRGQPWSWTGQRPTQEKQEDRSRRSEN